MDAAFKKKLVGGKRLRGALLSLPSPELAWIIAESGFDWIFIDAEHGLFVLKDIQHILQTIQNKVACLVRIPLNDEIWFKRILDLGVSGIIVPQVNTADEAARAVKYAKYPPEGNRSVGPARASGFGMHFNNYIQRANADTSLIVQIEHREAVKNIRAILEVEGIDAVFAGPFDLSASLNKTGLVNDEEVTENLNFIIHEAMRAEKPAGIFGLNADFLNPWIDKGYTLITAGTDTGIFASGAAAVRASLK